MLASPVIFTPQQQKILFASLRAGCAEFQYELTDASIESWHVHWMCHHGFDPVATMVGRLKNRMRQALDIGRIWTEGYFDSKCFEAGIVDLRSKYIGRHAGCRMSAGRIISH